MYKHQGNAVDQTAFELRLMGRPRVFVGGKEKPINATKQLLLLARLARAPDRAATREQLASFLWPGSPPEKARASLRQALNRLRKSLGGPVDPFDVDPKRIALSPGLWITDLEDLESSEGVPETSGTFLDGVRVREPEIEEWLETERRTTAVTVAACLRDAINACVADHGTERAIPLAVRLVALDRLDEDSHRLLMRLYHQSGLRSQAMAQFERLSVLLRDEIGEVPDQQSRQLAEGIRRGSPPASGSSSERHSLLDGASDAIAAGAPAFSKATASDRRNIGLSNGLGGVEDASGILRQPLAGRQLSPPAHVPNPVSSAGAPSKVNQVAIRRRWRISSIVALLVTMACAASWWAATWWQEAQTAPEVRMAYPLPLEPSIAVLPFVNLTSGGVPNLIADGLVEEIITSLTKIPQLFVIDGNSTFTYKGREVAAAEVAKDLGVRFVMDGSMRGTDELVRITANLTDALEGRQVWSEIYDRAPEDVLALQSEVARRIATELNVKLVSGELARLQENTTNDPQAYALFLEAQASPRSSREDVLRRIQLYEASLARDPGFAAAMAAWAIDLARMGRTGLADRDVVYPRAEEIAEAAIEADPSYSGGYLALSTVRRFQGEFEQSLQLVERALEIAPNDADAIMYKGRMLRLLPGRAEEAIVTIEQAMRLNPFYPPDYLSQLSWAYFAAERYKEAHEIGLDYAELRPNHDHGHWRLAMTYSILGEAEKAAEAVAATRRLNPKRTIAATLAASPYALSNSALISAEVAAMRAAGFPEQ